MLRIVILTIVLAATPADVLHKRELQNPDCAKVSITCPDEVDTTKPMKFTAKVTGGKRYGEVTYNWSVTKGTIKSGQGTATIEVDLEGQDCQGLTATVEVGGVEPDCTRNASCSVCTS